MANFENGWICQKCWGANREQDRRCYRCHTLSPMEERLLAMEAAQGPPPPGTAVRVRRRIGEGLLASGTRLGTIASRMAAAGRAGWIGTLRAAGWALTLTTGAVRAVITLTTGAAVSALAGSRRAARTGRRTAASAGRTSVLRLRTWGAASQRAAAGLAMTAMRAARAGQRHVMAVWADVRRAARNARRLVPARR